MPVRASPSPKVTTHTPLGRCRIASRKVASVGHSPDARRRLVAAEARSETTVASKVANLSCECMRQEKAAEFAIATPEFDNWRLMKRLAIVNLAN